MNVEDTLRRHVENHVALPCVACGHGYSGGGTIVIMSKAFNDGPYHVGCYVPKAEAEIERLRRERDEWRECANAERDELLALLRELEWCGSYVAGEEFETFQCCPVCEADQYDGKHKKGCRLAALIGGVA